MFYALLLLLIGLFSIDAINYEDNDLAKGCRPLDRQLDLLFILDGSGSVSGNTFATQMLMLNRIVNMTEIGPKNTQIAAMQYSSYTRVEFGFSANPSKEAMRSALQKIRHLSGTTRTGKALDKALQVFKHDLRYGVRLNQEEVAPVAVVVTDGHSHDDPIPAASRLRQAGVQILALGIGSHINMNELVEITGDENLAFQNLTSDASLDKFLHQFRKIAVGEHCEFSRGPQGAEIICKSDSIEIGVTTVNPFRGHLYVAGQFHRSECIANAPNSTAKEITLTVGLNTCKIQNQFRLNPKGILSETTVILKFHPTYNTKTDKIFKIQCFYPEKAIKLPSKYRDNRRAISDNSSQLRLPCIYRLKLKSSDECNLRDIFVGDQIVHSWECDRESFDTYQSMFIHSCILIDANTGINKTIIDSNGCSTDSSVIDSPEYVDPMRAFAVGTAVKFPDSSLIQMQCNLRFCDRLLGECDRYLPLKCRRPRRSAEPNSNSEFDENTPFIALNRSWDFADDDDYDGTEISDRNSTNSDTVVAPLVTFPQPHTENDVSPPHRRLPVEMTGRATRPEVEARGLATAQVQLQDDKLDKSGNETSRTLLNNGFVINGLPRLINFPIGGMDVKLNSHNLAIVSNDDVKQQYQKEIKETLQTARPSSIDLLPMQILSRTEMQRFEKKLKPKSADVIAAAQSIKLFDLAVSRRIEPTTTATSHSTSTPSIDPFQEFEKSPTLKTDSQESDELMEMEPMVRIEKRIADTVRADRLVVESQIVYIRHLEAVGNNLSQKEKFCQR